jgi:hypothetical protein
VGPDGNRLGKRDGALSTSAILGSGTTPEQLVGWLAWSAGLVRNPAPARARDLIGVFDERALASEPTSTEGDPWASST